MLEFATLVVAALFAVACTNTAASSDDSSNEVGVIHSAIGNEDANDFRIRTVDNKSFNTRKDDCNEDPRVALGLVSANVCVGADLFFREGFGGNGRACGSCHTAQFDFTISPEFIDSLEPDDPLFVAENDPALAQLEIPALMRGFGLILENVDGPEAPTTKFVMRAVPHAFSLAKSLKPAPIVNMDGTAADGTTQPPNQRTGWGGDGAPDPGGLKQFQAGAIVQHYTKSLNRVAGVDFIEATDEQLSRIEDFLLSVGRSDDIDIANIALTDLGAESGRLTYIPSRCNGCHVNAGANVAAGFNRNFDTGVEAVRLAVLDSMNIPRDGGFGKAPPNAPFNHDSNGDGIADSFGKGSFSTPPLIEAADTAPFFHGNSAATLEDAITFYTTAAFANSLAGNGSAIAFDATQVANVGKFLRVLNASFNCQLAVKRLDAVVQIVGPYMNHFKGLQEGLLDAAQAEIRDAIAVLSEVGIHSAERTHLAAADQAITAALSNSSHTHRLTQAQTALAKVVAANQGLGSSTLNGTPTTPLNFGPGQGTLMF